MNGIKTFALPAVLSLSLAGCWLDDNDKDPLPEPAPPPVVVNASLQVVHASVDAPDVNVNANGSAAVTALSFAQASEVLSLAPATYSVAVDAILPDDTTATVIGPVDLTLAEAMRYTVFAVGKVADQTLEPIVVTGTTADVSAGKIRLQVVHAAAGAPEVDIHVTAPDAELGSPLATLMFKDSTEYVEVDPGQYQVRIALPGTDTVVFDSGSLDLSTAGTDLVVAAIDSRFSGESPVSLLAIGQDGSEMDILDADATSSVRVVHNVSDAPAVDVIVNDAITLVNALAFPDFTDYVPVAPETYNVKVAADADNSVVVIDADLALEAGAYYSVLAVGALGENTVEPLVLADMPRRVATEAKVRIVHGSTLAGEVDIYVTASEDISVAAPAFTAVPFKAETGYVALAAGDYVVTVTPTGSKTAAIGPVALTLEANQIYTAVARDGIGLTTDVGLILLDDFVQ